MMVGISKLKSMLENTDEKSNGASASDKVSGDDNLPGSPRLGSIMLEVLDNSCADPVKDHYKPVTQISLNHAIPDNCFQDFMDVLGEYGTVESRSKAASE